MSYYEKELEQIDTDNQYAPTIQIKDANGNKTKCLDLNEESAKHIILWLCKFLLKKYTNGTNK